MPQEDFWHPPAAITLGGWLGGALQWHFTFMWLFAGAALVYLVGQFASGRYRMVLFVPRDIPGVWPMVRHYFLRGPKPPVDQPYNPLQKLAYTTTLLLGALSIVSGLALYKSAQLPVAGDDARRVRAGAGLALLRAVRLRGVRPRPSRDGGDSRLAELHGDADRMEAGSGVCEAVAPR